MRFICFLLLTVLNLYTFLAYGWDKRKAKKGAWRTREKTLLLLAACFGAAGAFAGMRYFHHKTRKPPFYWLVPLLLIVQIAVIGLLLWKRII